MCQVMRPPNFTVGSADGAAERSGRKRRIAFPWRKAAHRFHAAKKGKRRCVGDHAFFVDHARKHRNFSYSTRQRQIAERCAPFGEALRSERGIEEAAARGEQQAQALETGSRVG